MNITNFVGGLNNLGVDCFAGVPDSQLKALCDYIMTEYGVGEKHIVTANEGAAVGYAAGHYLATGNPTAVYMQNSGIGNAVNPICSLINDKVYAIPVVFIVGWRGEPGIKDEPQHIYQGEITIPLLDDLDIKSFIMAKETSEDEFNAMIRESKKIMAEGKSVAFVIKKGALETNCKPVYKNDYPMTREEIVGVVTEYASEGDIFVSTTGKLSRELFETREARNQSHKYDFLTVGSMGHSVMIALGVAEQKKNRKVYCLDGDGAVLMHTGSMAIVGANAPKNLIHVIVNNGAHETVGGVPTVADKIDLSKLALACGYKSAYTADNKETLVSALKKISGESGPILLEVKSNLLSRSDLGRPTTTPIQNKDAFMKYLAD